jgi:hypothetical protein
MTTKTIIVAIALLLGAAPAALAQSAYTTGSAAGNAAAGYPSPYGGSGLYAYVPDYGHVAVPDYGHVTHHRRWR